MDARSLLSAFDRGVNYFYHSTPRRAGMTQAIRELVGMGKREQLVVVLQSYSRWPWYLERGLRRGLTELGLDHADVLLLGWYNHLPGERIMERALKLRDQGMVRYLAVSGHRRPSFVGYAADPRLSVLHIRYNAAHPGAETDIFPHLPREGRPGLVCYTATAWGKLLKAAKMPPGEPPLRARDCYRFVLSNPNFNVCLCGPRDGSQLEEALAALPAGPLTPQEDERIRRIGRHVHG
ncbi:MAG: aldo/keto reductase [Myxococcales bacterium]|nr:aldo/keto reductase [Myxococcales bacterium]